MVLPGELLFDSAATLRLVGELLDEFDETGHGRLLPELHMQAEQSDSAASVLLRAYAEVVSVLVALQDGRRAIGLPAGRFGFTAGALPLPRPASPTAPSHDDDADATAETRHRLEEAWTLLRELEQRVDALADLLDSGVREAFDASDAA